MASSKKTLDIDILTVQDIYVKSQSGSQVSSYTMAIIPGCNTIIKQLQYVSPQQALSTASININPSTIPRILASITGLTNTQTQLANSISSVSSTTGYSISTVQVITTLYYNSATGTTYGPTYSNILEKYSSVQAQNISTLEVEGTVLTLGYAFSSISSQFSPNFSTLGQILEITFNQGPSVSSLSSYFTTYFAGLAENIPIYSTSINLEISTFTGQDQSTLVGYGLQIDEMIAQTTGQGVSTLSTVMVSTFSSFLITMNSYNPGYGISTLSTVVTSTLDTLSTNFVTNSGIPGICSLSTVVSLTYQGNISSVQALAGTNALCSFSTYLTTEITNLTTFAVENNIGDTVSTFSSLLFSQINTISTVVSTIGYVYTILQQESVKISISTLSTSFGNDFDTIASLSSFSSMLDSAYSTIDTLFSLINPSTTLVSISTASGSNTSTLLTYMSTVYPSIYSGPGLSSLSSSINPNFSSLSTVLDGVFNSFSNSVKNISSIRADPGICTLSTFFNTSTLLYASSYSTLFFCTNTVATCNINLFNQFIGLSNYDAASYVTYNPASAIVGLSNIVNDLSTSINTQYTPLVANVQTLSSFVGSNVSSLIANYGGVQSYGNLVATELISSYTAISTIVEQNIYSPTFSSFTTDIITTSNLTVTQLLLASSIGINQSTNSELVLAVIGASRFLPQNKPAVNTIITGVALNSGPSLFTNLHSNATNQFTTQGNDIAYNGSTWVTVGSDPSYFIKYSQIPDIAWSNSTYSNTGTLLQMNCVKWNGSYWLAGGSGNTFYTDPNLLQSPDGITWLAAPGRTSKMATINDITWNGSQWVAVGSDPTGSNILYTDQTAIWRQAINSFDVQGHQVTNNGRIWVAVGAGSNSIKYSYNAKNWEDVVGPQLSTGLTVAWNGDKFVAAGSNGNSSNIMYSYDGINWTYIPTPYVTQQGTSVIWDGLVWKLAGTNVAAPTLGAQLISYDAVTWSTINPLVTTGILYGQACASNTIPSIQLSNFDIFSGEFPAIMNTRKRMNIIQSTIYFNDGDLTIRHIPSTIAMGNIGINTTYPEYALDIGVGNARKIIGSTWVTASDARVKSDIVTADLATCAKLVSEIPLRQYTFTNEFQKQTGIRSDLHYGFIAQEVKQVLPDAIRYTKEFGLDDFHSLDTDQIFKLEFGATQYILQKLADIEQQVSTLENKNHF